MILEYKNGNFVITKNDYELKGNFYPVEKINNLKIKISNILKKIKNNKKKFIFLIKYFNYFNKFNNLINPFYLRQKSMQQFLLISTNLHQQNFPQQGLLCFLLFLLLFLFLYRQLLLYVL